MSASSPAIRSRRVSHHLKKCFWVSRRSVRKATVKHTPLCTVSIVSMFNRDILTFTALAEPPEKSFPEPERNLSGSSPNPNYPYQGYAPLRSLCEAAERAQGGGGANKSCNEIAPLHASPKGSLIAVRLGDPPHLGRGAHQASGRGAVGVAADRSRRNCSRVFGHGGWPKGGCDPCCREKDAKNSRSEIEPALRRAKEVT